MDIGTASQMLLTKVKLRLALIGAINHREGHEAKFG